MGRKRNRTRHVPVWIIGSCSDQTLLSNEQSGKPNMGRHGQPWTEVMVFSRNTVMDVLQIKLIDSSIAQIWEHTPNDRSREISWFLSSLSIFVNKYLFFPKWELSRTTTIIVQFMMLCHPLVIRLAEDDEVLISNAGWNECERRTWRQWMWDSVNNRAHLTFIVQILLHKWDVLMGTATSTTYCIGWMYHRHMTRKLNGASRLSRL